MTIDHLNSNYSYVADALTIVTCLTISIIIRMSLFFLEDKKFEYLKRVVGLLLTAALSNIIFYMMGEYGPYIWEVLVGLKFIYHILLIGCMHIFVLYIRDVLEAKGEGADRLLLISKVVFSAAGLVEVIVLFMGLFHENEESLWYNPFINPFIVAYAYGMFAVFFMLSRYKDRIIRNVRYSFVLTEMLVISVMLASGVYHASTYITFTYIIPVIVVIILLHSTPYDDITGAIGGKSINSYLERAHRRGVSLDFLILRLDISMESQIPVELGKMLSTFWHRYYKSAMLFSYDKGEYVLIVPRTSKNGNSEEKINALFYSEFPKAYEKFKYDYKIIGLYDVDHIYNVDDIRGITEYLSLNMDNNSIMIASDELKNKIRTMGVVSRELVDIDKKNDLDDERVVVYCQPIYNISTNRYDTAEALMRLNIENYGMIYPDMFIPLAENYGHIRTLSRIILNKVCKQIKFLEDEGYDFKRISVNFSVADMRSENFCSTVLGIIEKNGINPSKIGIELTESQNESDYNIIKDKITLLKGKGISFYLDDFGTGYSNLERIFSLGMDVIKYDRSLLLASDGNDRTSFMVKHFAEAFKQFDYDLVFEGVETSGQEELCIDFGADYLQGYKFSKPIPVERLTEFFSKTA